jgi:hypothetical protein
MSKSPRSDRILDQAKVKEKKYYWAEAAKLYEQALRMVAEKDFWRGERLRRK